MPEKSVSPEIVRDVLELIEAEVRKRSIAMDFEAYQVQVAIDRSKFAIKHAEAFGDRTDQMREVGIQLVDALEGMQSADRNASEVSRYV